MDLAATTFGALTAALVAVPLGWFAWRQRRHGQRLAVQLEQASRCLDGLQVRDVLTGMPKRAEFEAELDAAVTECDRDGGSCTLLYVDVDNLRLINDAFGHDAGDGVLRIVGARLLAADCPCARVAGDEFLLLVRGDLDRAREFAFRLRELLERPVQVAGRELRLSASIGFASYPLHGARKQLVANAAAATRAAKHAGGGAHAEYDPSMKVDKRDEAELLSDLRIALERRQLELFYQPEVDARSMQITAAEALLRWRHPRRGVVSPALFVPVAERHGLIGAIGNWVIEEACRQAREWNEVGLAVRVCVNLSGYQMRQDDLVVRLGRALQRHHVPPARFTCEITESVAMEDTRVTRQAIAELGALGVRVSIDDFGTGYSSLSSLRKLPAAELKIDRAFVRDLDTSADARSIVGAIVQMAHTLGLQVVAEGVETVAQRDRLVALGCDELQGYLFAKPMSAKALALWAGGQADGAPRALRPAEMLAAADDLS